MNKFIAALGLTLASGIALAQPPAGPGEGPEGRGKGPSPARMQQELGLSDEQVQKMREIRESGGSSEEVRAVLTPEQQAKAAEMRKEHRGERLERMQERLGLSDEQVAKMREVRQNGGSREEMRAILTPEQQAKFDEARSENRGKGQGKAKGKDGSSQSDQ